MAKVSAPAGTPPSPIVTPTTGQIAKVSFAAGFGGFIEYYDLFIASIVGASVWPEVFFRGGIASSVGFSIASVGVAFVVRPLGGLFFGHIGDRVGRRNTLVLTLALMGISVFLIGFLPSYATIGIAAPVLLFILRGLFGLGLGGEYGGGVAWILEFAAKSRWRSFWSVWVAPASVALTVASGSFAAIAASMSHADLLSFGWRIPFIVGGLMIVIAYIMRFRLQESPLFAPIRDRGEVARAPSVSVIRGYWKQIIALASISGSIQAAITSCLLAPFSLSYLAALGYSPASASSMLFISNGLAIITFVAGPYFSEKLGRKKHLLIALIWAVIGVVIFLPLMNTLTLTWIALAYIIPEMQVGFNNSAVQAISGETFPIKYRYSGAGFSYQLGNGFIAGIILTFLIPWLIESYGVKLAAPYLVVTIVIWQLIGMACLLLLKETKTADMAQ